MHGSTSAGAGESTDGTCVRVEEDAGVRHQDDRAHLDNAMKSFLSVNNNNTAKTATLICVLVEEDTRVRQQDNLTPPS